MLSTKEKAEIAELRTDSVWVVREDRVIFWPNGDLRGEAGYAVTGDDPYMDRYWRNGVPAMLERNDDATPNPPSEWPPRWRREAGDEFLTAAEQRAAADAERVAAEAKKKKGEQEKRIKSEISKPDED